MKPIPRCLPAYTMRHFFAMDARARSAHDSSALSSTSMYLAGLVIDYPCMTRRLLPQARDSVLFFLLCTRFPCKTSSGST